MREKQRSTEIRFKASIETVEAMIRKRRLRWLGHVARMDPERIPRKLLVCRLKAGKHAVGGQKLRWADAVTKDLKRCKIDKDWREVAQNRNEWNIVTETIARKLNVEAEELEK